MIANMKVSLTYGKKITQDGFMALKSIFPNHAYLRDNDDLSRVVYFNEEIIADAAHVSELLLPHGCFTIEILSLGNGTMVVRMQDRIRLLLNEGVVEEITQLIKGGIVQITIPDIGLLQMDEVTWREDSCTEEIQELLNDGWRILAICPPNAQRRPDYILGRRKPR